MKIRIATRQSELALFQANYVAEKLNQLEGVTTELIPLLSEGDQTDKPLHEIGGKGLFVNRLESALISGDADIAVHSLKDVPAVLDNNFEIASIFQRESACDILLSKEGWSLDTLPINSVIGTSSPRRKSQILNLRPDLNTIPVRGNIATRVKKLNDGAFDALIIAKAALNRLNLNFTNAYEFTLEEMLPAASQGFIGIECIKSNTKVLNILKQINNDTAYLLAEAERAFVAKLNGSCLSPIAIYCFEEKEMVHIIAKVLSQDGQKKLHKKIISSKSGLKDDILTLANDFVSKGSNTIIQE